MNVKKIKTLVQLSKEFQIFCSDNNLPQMSADDLLSEATTGDVIKLTAEQHQYIKGFIQCWNDAEEKEHNETEYKKEFKAIEDEAEKKRQDLYRAYAASQRVCLVGDIVTDSQGSIKVEKFGTYLDVNRIPMPTYIGIELKKDLTPTKKGEKRTVYQTNIMSYEPSK